MSNILIFGIIYVTSITFILLLIIYIEKKKSFEKKQHIELFREKLLLFRWESPYESYQQIYKMPFPIDFYIENLEEREKINIFLKKLKREVSRNRSDSI